MTERSRGRKRPKPPTKDKVLQARIPGELDEELRDRATSLGLSVSTIVRNVLMNTFDLVEGVVQDSTELARNARGLAKPPASEGRGALKRREGEGATAVVAWQQATLNLNAVCDRCNAILPKGTQAAVGIPIPAQPVFLCPDCLASLAQGSPPDSSA